MLVRYKYDKNFNENEFKQLYEELWTLIEPSFISFVAEIGVYKNDKSIEDGKKLLTIMISKTLNAGLEYYKIDTHNTPFMLLLRKFLIEIHESKEFKETLATC